MFIATMNADLNRRQLNQINPQAQIRETTICNVTSRTHPEVALSAACRASMVQLPAGGGDVIDRSQLFVFLERTDFEASGLLVWLFGGGGRPCSWAHCARAQCVCRPVISSAWRLTVRWREEPRLGAQVNDTTIFVCLAITIPPTITLYT